MKISSKIMKKAHNLTKEIKNKYPEVNYKFQLGICIKYLLSESGVGKMIELKGSEKQIKWAVQIRAEILKCLDIIDANKANAPFVNTRAGKENFKELRKYITEDFQNAGFYINNFKMVTNVDTQEDKLTWFNYGCMDAREIDKNFNINGRYIQYAVDVLTDNL